MRRLLPLLLLLAAMQAQGAGPVYRVGVDGLACPFCAYGVEKQLHKLDGIARLDTNIEQGLVVVTMQTGKTLTRDHVTRAVEKAGFTLRSFERADQTASS